MCGTTICICVCNTERNDIVLLRIVLVSHVIFLFSTFGATSFLNLRSMDAFGCLLLDFGSVG
jgi:hypothetical protein